MLKLNIYSTGGDGEIRSRLKDVYERIAGSDDYARNQSSLRLIQVCVITISACATGFVNAFAHKERLGWVGASLLAIFITGFVEKFYFALRHGLTTIYKSRKQRFIASLCYRVIQITMILNAGILCAWVTGSELPESLKLWNQYSIAIHFSLALIGVSAVRDSDAVVEDRIRKLKAEAVQEDILTTRRAAINDNPLVLAAARLRGFLDGMSLAANLLRDKPDLSSKEDVGHILDAPQRLCLPDRNDGNTQADNDRYFGKTLAPVNTPETGDQSQACSPAQNDRSELGEQVKSPGGERHAKVAAGSEQNGGEEAGASNGVSKSDSLRAQSAPQSGARPGEQDKKDCEAAGEQLLRASQWLKSILPEATNGWWDVRGKGSGMTIKFRWRDPGLQVITLLRVTSEQFEILKQSDYEDAKSQIREKISLRLHSLSLDPAKRDKALIAAWKLGIDLG